MILDKGFEPSPIEDEMIGEELDAEEQESEEGFYDSTIRENKYDEDFLPEDTDASIQMADRAIVNKRTIAEQQASEEEEQGNINNEPYVDDSSFTEEERQYIHGDDDGEPTELQELATEVEETEKEWGEDFAEGGMKALKSLAGAHKEASQDPDLSRRIVLGGIGDAAQEVVNAGISFYDWGVDDALGINMLDSSTRLEIMDKLVPSSNTSVENIGRGLVSFAVGYGSILKGVQGIKSLQSIGTIKKSMAIVAMADALVFDPKDGNMTTLLRDSGILRGPISEYLDGPLSLLDSTEAKSEAEGRLRNAVEGALLTSSLLAVESIAFITGVTVAALKGYKYAGMFKRSVSKMKLLKTSAVKKASDVTGEFVGSASKSPERVAAKEAAQAEAKKGAVESRRTVETFLAEDAEAKIKLLEKDKSPAAFAEARKAQQLAEDMGVKVPSIESLAPSVTKVDKGVQLLNELATGKFTGDKIGNRSIFPVNTTEEVRRVMKGIVDVNEDSLFIHDKVKDVELVKEAQALNMSLKDFLDKPEDIPFTPAEIIAGRFIEAKVAHILQGIAERTMGVNQNFHQFIQAQEIATEVMGKMSRVANLSGRILAAHGTSLPSTAGFNSLGIIRDTYQMFGDQSHRRLQKALADTNPNIITKATRYTNVMPLPWALLEAKINSLLMGASTLTKSASALASEIVVEPSVLKGAELISRWFSDTPTHVGHAEAHMKALQNSLESAFIYAYDSMKMAKAKAQVKAIPHELRDPVGQKAISFVPKRTNKKLGHVKGVRTTKNVPSGMENPTKAAATELKARTEALRKYTANLGLTGSPSYTKAQRVGTSNSKLSAVPHRRTTGANFEGAASFNATKKALMKIFGKNEAETILSMAEYIDIAGDVVNMPSTTLISMDEFAKAIIRNSYKQRKWLNIAQEMTDSGISKEDIDARYKTYMSSQTIVKEAHQYAENVALTGEIPRIGSTVIDSPSNKAQLRHNGDKLGLQGDTLSGVLEDVIRIMPFSRISVPFARIGFNIGRRVSKHVPGLAQMLPEVRAAYTERHNNPAGWHYMLSRQAVGATALGAMYAISSWNEGLVTGNGPGDLDQRIFWQETLGNVPNAVTLGPYSVPLDALGIYGQLFSLSAQMAELSAHSENTKQAVEELAADVSMAVGVILEPQYLTETTGGMIQAIRSGDINTFINFLTTQPSTLVPQQVKRFRRVTDPQKRVTRGANQTNDPDAGFNFLGMFQSTINKIKNSIPGWSDSLPAAVNRLGKPIYYPPGAAANVLSPFASTYKTQGVVEDELRTLFSSHAPLAEKDAPVRVGDMKIRKPRIAWLPSQFQFDNETYYMTGEEHLKYKELAAGIGLREDPSDKNSRMVEPIYDVLKNLIDRNYKTNEFSISDNEKKYLGEDFAKRRIITAIFNNYKTRAEAQMYRDVFFARETQMESIIQEGRNPQMRE